MKDTRKRKIQIVCFSFHVDSRRDETKETEGKTTGCQGPAEGVGERATRQEGHLGVMRMFYISCSGDFIAVYVC